MWGADQLLSLGDPALRIEGTAGVEVVVTRTHSALTRFAGSRIHQNTSRDDGEARVRVVLSSGQVAVTATSTLTPAAVRLAAESARAAAALMPADPGFAGLAPGGATYREAAGPDAETATCTPAHRAQLVAEAIGQLPEGVHGAGTVETSLLERAVTSTTGTAVHGATTRAAATVLATGADSSSWASADGTALALLDLAALGRRAAGKVRLGAAPRDLPPGRYPVVLEPGATVVLAQWLAWLAFAGRAYNEGRSAVSGRLGEQVCSPLVTLVDDALSPLLPALPFDAEGTPTGRTALIEAGRAVGVVHDRATGQAAGSHSTGHALPAPNPTGGLPGSLLMSAGDHSLDDLVAGVERGLYVTRFHYANVVHPVTPSITGMTRDGTFLVEDGQIVGGVRDLRFTESILAALSGVEAVGREVEVASDLFYGAACAPALRLSGFTFSSAY